MRGWIAAYSAALLFASALPSACGVEARVIRDMDRAAPFTATEIEVEGKKMPAGTMVVVPGKTGHALQFHFVAGARSGFFLTSLTPTPEWDRAGGLTFWVKGDGSESWGGIELIDEAWRGRYAYCFPVNATGWRKVEIPWRDFLPETATAPLFGAGMKPSAVRYLAFGKWHYWRDYPAETFAIDEISLLPARPAPAPPRVRAGQTGVARTLAKLKAHQPITVVTMGDSLSDKQHWANREVLWSELLSQELKARYGGPVTLVNPAIGGAELAYGLIYAPRWLAHTPAPDLITVLYGYNDASDGSTPAVFKERLELVVDSLRRLTDGRSDILLLTTCPAVGRWTELEGLAQAVREVAREKQTGLADVSAAFHATGDADQAARKSLYCSDEVHLGPAGHRLTADTVGRAVAGAK